MKTEEVIDVAFQVKRVECTEAIIFPEAVPLSPLLGDTNYSFKYSLTPSVKSGKSTQPDTLTFKLSISAVFLPAQTLLARCSIESVFEIHPGQLPIDAKMTVFYTLTNKVAGQFTGIWRYRFAGTAFENRFPSLGYGNFFPDAAKTKEMIKNGWK